MRFITAPYIITALAVRLITALAVTTLTVVHSAYGDDMGPTSDDKSQQRLIEVAIIIDDIGYNKRQGLAALALPGEITYAIIPHSPNATFLAKAARKQNKEVMLHAPMSNVHNYPLGESGLTEHMDETDFNEALNKALNSVPHITGVNNHMGSLLTQKRIPMEWIMQALNKKGLYFIDSRTTSHSVAWKTAQHYNVPSLKRDVFLDHERNTAFITQQFSKLIAVAKRRGYAIAIAHPYPETIDYLSKNIATLKEQGIRLVPASHLVNLHSPNRRHIHAKNVN
ncbi:MAG: divergent polysaccharide deacetylase family protein [Cellvibrionaceae bacterium]